MCAMLDYSCKLVVVVVFGSCYTKNCSSSFLLCVCMCVSVLLLYLNLLDRQVQKVTIKLHEKKKLSN